MVDLENRDDIVEHFKSEFEDFQPAVDSRIWDNIERELHPEKKKGVIWWKWAAAASIVLGLTYIGLEQISGTEEIAIAEKNKNVQEPQIATEPSITNSPSESVAPEALSESANKKSSSPIEATNESNQENFAIEVESTGLPPKDVSKQKLNLTNTKDEDKHIAPVSIASTDVVPDAVEENIQNSSTAITFVPIPPQVLEIAESQTQQGNSEEAVVMPDTDIVSLAVQVDIVPESIAPLAEGAEDPDSSVALTEEQMAQLLQNQSGAEDLESTPEPSSKGWVLAANLLSMSGGTEAVNGPEVMDMSSSLSFSNTTVPNSFQPASAGQNSIFPGKEFGDITYLPPITTSITANFQISKKWSIESGLSYSLLLSSRETNEVNGEKDVLNVRMNYLGIPLLIKFDILSSRKLMFYSNIGGMIDMGLKGRDTYTTVKGGSVTGEAIQRYNIDGLNLSASAGLGLDYRINKLLSYYLQPGISAQFLGDGYLFNVRNNKLLWPNVTTGLRVHLNPGK